MVLPPLVQPPSRSMMNAGYEIYSAVENSETISEAVSSVSDSIKDLYHWATSSTPSPIDNPNNRREKRDWLQHLVNWKDGAEDCPTLESMAYSGDLKEEAGSQAPKASYQAVRVLLLSWENEQPQAIARTNVMRRLEDLFRDSYKFVVYSYKFQQPANQGETIESAFSSWLIANKFLTSLEPSNQRELVIIVCDGNTGTGQYNDFRLYGSDFPDQNSLSWDLLQKRFIQGPYDTLQIFNWTYRYEPSPAIKVNNPNGANLVLAASGADCTVVQEFTKNDHWQFIFLTALYKTLQAAGGPLSVKGILAGIMAAHDTTRMKEVDRPRIFELPSEDDGDEAQTDKRTIVVAPLKEDDDDGWVALSHCDYWSQRSVGEDKA
ncbi:hypothetical protein QBC40DRAFT_267877 [Triangularia verruculosa]|uniref:Uncharacterized protein n=1 Tax=Triangularia verruculosa TaxID=2587418 RepID=A0AAN6XCR3_9PEZI|nr:hypothetical protein QBC40DRAFT_267877 [Triangularia verruculosa]